MTSRGLPFRAPIWGPLLKRPVQALGMVASIALGVAIVAAIHWIDASALYSFQQGVDALLGRGDTTLEAVQGPLADGLLPEVRQIAEVEAAFPALEMELVLEG